MATRSDIPEAPLALSIDLRALAAGAVVAPRPWEASFPWLDGLGRLGGGALGLSELVRRELAGEPAALAVCVGRLVRRGFPTAARASVAGRAALTGLYSEGLVGGPLGRTLARYVDGLFVSGQVAGSGNVLVIDAAGVARLHAWTELAGRSPRATHAALLERLGPCGTLSIGLAGERGVALASLASGGDVPHFVGRGGLGAVLGRMGLKAIAVCGTELGDECGAELKARLARSPRLLARASGGTLELFDAFAARPEGAANGADFARLGAQARDARAGRHGCSGCPTPCGWEFDTRRGARQPARFGASHALSSALGYSSLDDALELLRACDELGLDAKEVGAALALVRPRDLAHALALLADACEARGEGARLALGSVRLARELGLSTPSAKGAAVRADAALAALLGQCVSSRGGDPMRTFPFLALDGAALDAFAVSTGLDLPPEAADPEHPCGKGTLVAWHEDWANALDMTGFCAFSAAALLSDGLCDPRELAHELAPQLDERSFSLLDAGAALSTLQRLLNERLGATQGSDVPEWAAARLRARGAWDEYARWRGLDEHTGRLLPTRIAALQALRPWRAARGADVVLTPAQARGERALGTVRVLIAGESPRELSLALPATVDEVLTELCRAEPRWSTLRPAVYRSGKALGLRALVSAGDELALLLVIAGG
ncbi:MAG: hypothetical protein FJ298_00940 [Planctomycetes bacterium]|nr:hypothetical protein [Planctomycetota bacterium]